MGRIAISVTSGGQGMNTLMDERFGRAEAFVVVDKKTGKAVETIVNASVAALHGAGTAAANLLKSAGVDAVISGRFGPKAFDALRALGIETFVAPPGITAEQALSMFSNDDLEPMKSQDDQ